MNNNILEKSGSWFSYKGERIGQGRENARQFLKDNKDTMAKLDTEVRKALGLIAKDSPSKPVEVPKDLDTSQGVKSIGARLQSVPPPPPPRTMDPAPEMGKVAAGKR